MKETSTPRLADLQYAVRQLMSGHANPFSKNATAYMNPAVYETVMKTQKRKPKKTVALDVRLVERIRAVLEKHTIDDSGEHNNDDVIAVLRELEQVEVLRLSAPR